MTEETEPNTGNENEPQFTPITSQEQLDKLIGERINKVKSQFGDYDDLRTKAAEYDKAQESAKSESQRLADDRDGQQKRADAAEGELLRLRVGISKGLTDAQARRLVGSSKEELEADADDLLATFGGQASESTATTTSTRPTENLRGGGNPETEPAPDMHKVVADIPRR